MTRGDPLMMQHRIAKLTIVAGLAMFVFAGSAQAQTRSQAVTSAKGWQHYVCVEDGGCLSWDAISPTCGGPSGGSSNARTCNGYATTTHCRSNELEVESTWNALGRLIHNWQGCVGVSQNARPAFWRSGVKPAMMRSTVANAKTAANNNQRRVCNNTAGLLCANALAPGATIYYQPSGRQQHVGYGGVRWAAANGLPYSCDVKTSLSDTDQVLHTTEYACG